MKPSIAWALVGMQFGAIAALVVFPAGTWWDRGVTSGTVAAILLAAGLVLVALSGQRLGRSLTPSPIPREDATLVTTGVYSRVRHPIYTGLLVAAAGGVVWGASLAHLVAWLFLFAVLSAKVAGEESLLREKFEDYGSYVSRTGRFFPKFPAQTR
jgi:protein-S-isoprenylcysteine O-methyltransferase Ste14